MAKEADFYNAEEAGKALGIPVRQVFGMLSSGELEGHQDEWARWRISVSAVQHAQRNSEPSSGTEEPPENDSKLRPAEDETPLRDAEATTVRNDGRPLWRSSIGTDLPSGEETTQESGEAPVNGRPEPSIGAESSDTETTERLPRGDHRETAVPDAASEEIIQELSERLAKAVAETRELRTRLEMAEFAEATLRQSLEHEREKAKRQRTQAERKNTAAEELEEEPKTERVEKFWRGLFGG